MDPTQNMIKARPFLIKAKILETAGLNNLFRNIERAQDSSNLS